MPRSLLDLIASVESPGYDVAYGGTKMPAGMTLEQTLAWQKAHGQKTGSSAVGRYQFIRPTLQGLVKESGLPLKTQFTPSVQDMLATKLLERRGLSDYVSGKLPPERFARNLSQEWAGLPSGPEGRSYYAGDQMGNKAGVGWDQVIRTLDRPDVRMAANTTGSTDTDRTPSGDPVTGRMNMLPPFTMAPPAPEAPAEADWLQPLVALIGGAAMGGGGGLGRAVQLAGGGMAAAQTAENELLELKQKRADAARRRQGQDALDRYADQLSQNPETAEIGAMMRVDPASGMRYYAETRQAQMEQQARQSYAQQLKAAGATDYQVAQAMAGQNPGQQDKPAGPAQYGLAPKQYIAADGKTVMERVYASDGSFVDRVLPGAPIAYDPETAAAVAAGQAKGKAQGGADETTRQGLVTLTTLYDEIVQTLPEATGSGLGALADQAAAFFGKSTKGAEAAQKLQVLGARLVGTVPRMEGPQSDRDVDMYRMAAGNLADPTIPAERKAAALATITEIARRQQATGNPAFAGIKMPGAASGGAPTAAGGDLSPAEQAELERLRGGK